MLYGCVRVELVGHIVFDLLCGYVVDLAGGPVCLTCYMGVL